MGVAMLLLGACWGAPQKGLGEPPQAWRADAPTAPLEPLALVPVVPVPEAPEAAPETTTHAPYVPFITPVRLPRAGAVRVATTNNSLDAELEPQVRGFPLCLRGDAVRYTAQWLAASAEIYTTAEVLLPGHLGNCTQMTGPVHYLVLDRAADDRNEVIYRVVSSTGFSPPVACARPGLCPLLAVSLPALERALNGLRLGALQAPSPTSEVPTDVLATRHPGY